MSKFEKIVIIILLIVLICLNVFTILVFKNIIDKKNSPQIEKNTESIIKKSKKNEIIIDGNIGEYDVYQNDHIIKSFMYYDDAVEFASKHENTSIKKYNGGTWLWDNTPQYNVYLNDDDSFKAFSTFYEAVNYANQYEYADIYYRKDNSFIWNNHESIQKSYMIKGVKSIGQYPELYRGCEVTSLTMLLNYKGINVDKITLAKNIKKDNTPYKEENGNIYYGNPNNGFVGDIYDKNKKGFGVYHKPIFELLQNYIGSKAIDVTGSNFEDLYYFLNKNIPVWVIINSKYDILPESSFETWITPEGKVKVTYSEHSVLITGYDENFIYINDPMFPGKTLKKNKDKFIAAWNQMGRQAVTYCQ